MIAIVSKFFKTIKYYKYVQKLVRFCYFLFYLVTKEIQQYNTWTSAKEKQFFSIMSKFKTFTFESDHKTMIKEIVNLCFRC